MLLENVDVDKIGGLDLHLRALGKQAQASSPSG